MGRNGVISERLSEKLTLMAGYRNRMVHFYHEVTNEELYEILTNNLLDFENFIKEMGGVSGSLYRIQTQRILTLRMGILIFQA